jgi:sugar/nucleoside kinase (ribokinase family)
MSPPRWDVLGLGENSIDDVYRVPAWPQPGVMTKTEITSHVRSPGGQVATTLCTCAALGLSTGYLGTFGNDDNGRALRQTLSDRGVDVRHARDRDAPNRHAVILVDERTGERGVLWQRDRALALRPEDVTREVVLETRLLHVDASDEDASIHAASIAAAAGIPVTSDIDTVTLRTRDLVAAVTIVIFGEGVAPALTGEGDEERALHALRRSHAGLLCVTQGARGAMLLAGDQLHRVCAHDVEVVDSTGAGDVFRGAFIYALLRGEPPAAILAFANAAAAVSCTRQGAITSVPRLTEVTAMLSRR